MQLPCSNFLHSFLWGFHHIRLVCGLILYFSCISWTGSDIWGFVVAVIFFFMTIKVYWEHLTIMGGLDSETCKCWKQVCVWLMNQAPGCSLNWLQVARVQMCSQVYNWSGSLRELNPQLSICTTRYVQFCCTTHRYRHVFLLTLFWTVLFLHSMRTPDTKAASQRHRCQSWIIA